MVEWVVDEVRARASAPARDRDPDRDHVDAARVRARDHGAPWPMRGGAGRHREGRDARARAAVDLRLDAGAAMRALLAERDIVLRTETRAAHVTDDVLWLESGDAVASPTPSSACRGCADLAIAGLPDARRRLPADRRPRLRHGGPERARRR